MTETRGRAQGRAQPKMISPINQFGETKNKFIKRLMFFTGPFFSWSKSAQKFIEYCGYVFKNRSHYLILEQLLYEMKIEISSPNY